MNQTNTKQPLGRSTSASSITARLDPESATAMQLLLALSQIDTGGHQIMANATVPHLTYHPDRTLFEGNYLFDRQMTVELKKTVVEQLE